MMHPLNKCSGPILNCDLQSIVLTNRRTTLTRGPDPTPHADPVKEQRDEDRASGVAAFRLFEKKM
jgi:hypothetical protein